MAATPVSVVQGAVASLDDDLLAIAGTGIAIGAVIFAVRKGWNVVRGFVK